MWICVPSCLASSSIQFQSDIAMTSTMQQMANSDCGEGEVGGKLNEGRKWQA